MEIICLTVGDLATNCYLVTDEETRHTLIIDPGDEGDFISTTLLENNFLPQAIILTHGHYDHCLACLELKLNFNIPIYLHQADLFLYQNAYKSHSYWSDPVGEAPRGRPHNPPIDFYLIDNQTISFGNSSLQVLHTPGHTPGSICLVSSLRVERGNLTPSAIFTGDTLFVSGVGSTDHAYSSVTDLKKSLSKLRTINLEQKTPPLIYPGHEDFGQLLDIAFPTVNFQRLYRQCKGKGRTLSLRTGKPNTSSGRLDNSFCQEETQSGSLRIFFEPITGSEKLLK